ncbi:hypothetical protein CSUI_007591, partial [Cystoisospora suis]
MHQSQSRREVVWRDDYLHSVELGSLSLSSTRWARMTLIRSAWRTEVSDTRRKSERVLVMLAYCWGICGELQGLRSSFLQVSSGEALLGECTRIGCIIRALPACIVPARISFDFDVWTASLASVPFCLRHSKKNRPSGEERLHQPLASPVGVRVSKKDPSWSQPSKQADRKDVRSDIAPGLG